MTILTSLSIIGLVAVAVPFGYLILLAAASTIPMRRLSPRAVPNHRFAVAIPAHDEEKVIAETVRRLRQLDYPADLFQVHIVADHCGDRTAELARSAGAVVHERNDGPRTGKGAALSWLFGRVLADSSYDAVVIFDGDTRVAPDFLRVMDARLAAGDVVIQGQHIIANPRDGWFPALTWAMFLIDNRINNWGRVKLGFSAKNMGDSICFRADVLRELGWGQGLTEDYQLRQRLLLKGIKIQYAPEAVGYGEAVATWSQARAQRARWLRGTHDASNEFRKTLAREAMHRHDLALLDGALQAFLPSYSTLSLVSTGLLVAQFAAYALGAAIALPAIALWTFVLIALFGYPLYGLALERAPFRAYLVILSGPVFIAWRSGLAYRSRFGRREVVWVRTSHGEAPAHR